MANISQIIKKLRKYEIRIRKLVNSTNQGNFSSIFKGVGLEFDDIRQYQYGDDVRTINWNVSAKGHGTFVKTFKEEKEQSVFFILDVSASQEIGKIEEQKIDIAKEICGVLLLASVREQSKVGFVAYSDEREMFIKSAKGNSKAYQIINDMFNMNPKSKKTDLNAAIQFTLRTLKRKSLVFLISDFIEKGIDKNLKNLSNKHDLVCIHLQDDNEANFPKLGIIPIQDAESGKTVWVNTSSSNFSKITNIQNQENKSNLEELSKKHQFNFLTINTKEDFVDQLVKLFKTRNLIKKRA